MRNKNKEVSLVCSNCSEPFTLLKNSKNPICKECLRKDRNKRSAKAQYWKKPEYKENSRKWRLKKYYDLTEEDYKKLLVMQGEVCAICKKPGDLVVDHNHNTGKVRGLLCHCCNRAIGQLQENYSTLRNASAYLMRHNLERNWDSYFIEFARLASTRSKDPSSQVGAVIVRNKLILSTGYNGFPKGVDDTVLERYERPLKYVWMCHAEENAVLNAAYHGISCLESTLYVSPFSPCSKCARAIVQSGIKEVVVDKLFDNPRFEEEFKQAKEIFEASNVTIREIQGGKL